MRHRVLAQQAQQQIRGMEFITIWMNNNNLEVEGQLISARGR
jgi:hypothetical protein